MPENRGCTAEIPGEQSVTEAGEGQHHQPTDTDHGGYYLPRPIALVTHTVLDHHDGLALR